MLAIALVLLGQGNTTFYLGIGTWIAMHVPYERRGKVTGLIEVSWAFGLLLGVSTMGLVTAASNWRVGYLAAPMNLIDRLVDTKLLSTLTTPSLLQRASHSNGPAG